MSRTVTNKIYGQRRLVGRAHGIARLKAKMKHSVRHHVDLLVRRVNFEHSQHWMYEMDTPVIEQPKKYRNFWWEWL